MPRRQAKVEQRDHFDRLQQPNGLQRELLVLPEFIEVLFSPREQLLRGLLAVGKIGKIGFAVREIARGLSRFVHQRRERDSMVADDDAEIGGHRVSGGEADDFHRKVSLGCLAWIRIRLRSL